MLGPWRNVRRGVVACATAVVLLLAVAPRAYAQTEDGADADASRDWVETFAASIRLLILEHGVRMAAEPKTRRELGGAFWGAYTRSVRWPRHWSDGDGWKVNYVGHPVHGAAAGWLWLEHAPARQRGTSAYVKSRLQAAAFAGVYSLQFEMGPISEASIGNVGLRPHTVGWTDLVATPVGAFGVMLLEDAADRYVLAWIDRRTSNRVVRAIARMTLNPGRGMANLSQGRAPWARTAESR